MKPFDVVRVVRLRDDRFAGIKSDHERCPAVGDTGTILEVYAEPEPAFEVECSNPKGGNTIWSEALYPEECEIAQSYP